MLNIRSIGFHVVFSMKVKLQAQALKGERKRQNVSTQAAVIGKTGAPRSTFVFHNSELCVNSCTNSHFFIYTYGPTLRTACTSSLLSYNVRFQLPGGCFLYDLRTLLDSLSIQ